MKLGRTLLIFSFVSVLIVLFTGSCSKKGVVIPTPVPGSPVTDIEGNVYKTVVIGTQTWMAENLKVTTYRNGDIIPNVADSTWSSLLTGAFCWYNNDSVKNRDIYGALYNFYAVKDARGLAPQGWHIPTDDEWSTLTTYLGGEDVAGTKLKEAGKTHWISQDAGGTNETGFTALPGGSLYNIESFTNLGKYGYWWSATEYSDRNAWFRGMYFSAGVFRNNSAKISGYSIRCLKD